MEKKLFNSILVLSAFMVTACNGGGASSLPSSEASSEVLSSSEESSSLVESSSEEIPSSSSKEYISKKEFTFSSQLPAEVSSYPYSSGGKTYYVSNEGNDSNDGLSKDSAFATIGKVNSLTLGAGDQVLFRKGDTFVGCLYFANLNTTGSNPITFASYGEGNRPVLTNGSTPVGSDVVSFQNCGNIVFRDLEVLYYGGSRNEGAGCGNTLIFRYVNCAKNKFKNIYIVNNVVHGAPKTGVNCIGADVHAQGIYIHSRENSYDVSSSETVSNINILNNEVYDLGRIGIHTQSATTKSGENQHDVHTDKFINVHMDYNHVHDIGAIGMYVFGGKNATMNHNLVHDTGTSTCSTVVEGETGMMFITSEDSECKFNEVYNVKDQNTGLDAMGIDIDWNTHNIDVAYNYCHHCQGSGIGTMATSHSFIRNNLIVDNECNTIHNASIFVSNFIPHQEIDGIHKEWLSVDHLVIAENLVKHNASSSKSNMFRNKSDNGSQTYVGNELNDNRFIYTNDDPNDFEWIMNQDLPWNSFNRNKYYAKDTTMFRAFDFTDPSLIENGAQPFTPDRKKSFDNWAVRDLGATFELINEDKPSPLSITGADYDGLNLTLNWESEGENTWHYQIHELGSASEGLTYLNLIGESSEGSFLLEPTKAGTHYFAVQAISNLGETSEPIIFTINL